jgi:hypothetical protein
MKIEIDLFPAHVQVAPANVFTDVLTLNSHPPQEGAFYVGTTRVIIMNVEGNQVVLVAQDSPEGAQIVFREKIAELQEPNDGTYRLITVSGKALAFKKDTNCGCGSRLRSWNPYRTIQSIKDPTE